MVEPLKALLKSRKFLLLVLDTIISLALYVTASFFPEAQDSVKEFIAILQPVFVSLIIAISVEDAAEKRANGS